MFQSMSAAVVMDCMAEMAETVVGYSTANHFMSSGICYKPKVYSLSLELSTPRI